MIMARAPFRVSFAGGGSDMKDYYAKNGYGAVLSTSINKYMYIMIHPYFHDKIRVKYSKTEDVDKIDDIQHPLVRECLKLVGVEKGIEIASIADVPAGTGLGSSSAFVVCLLHALYAYKGEAIDKERLAREACRIEIEILNEPIGKQDQYAASYGGFNFIRFDEDETVCIDPIGCPAPAISNLEKNLLMFYVGGERRAGDILKVQKKNIKKKENSEHLKKMVKMANDMKICLHKNRLDEAGEILHEAWLLKKKLAPGISNHEIDGYYDKALKVGAIGGKILGAGSGGFFLFYCREKYQNRVRSALGLRELKFKFEDGGSKIIFVG